jgi:hypothetical protein
MFKSINTKVLFPIVVSAFMLAACDKDKEEAGKASILSSNDTILRYVPADTPYVIANVEPLPDDLMDKIEPAIEQVLQSYQTVLREVIAMKQAEVPEEKRNNEEAQKIVAVVEELTTLFSIEGIREAGIGRDATSAIYGNGLLPVIRFDLSDGALLDATISRLEEKAGYKMSVASIEGGGYRYVDIDKLRIVIAILENQAVFTFVPSGFDDAQTAAALGLTPPETSIADSGVLEEIANKYGFTSHYAGFIDLEAIASTFVDPQTGVNADLLAMLEHDGAMLSDVCKAEIRSMAGIAPRMVLGYTNIDAKRLDSTFVIELREDIAAGLSALPAAVPGLGGDSGGLLSFGLSLDVKAARDFVEARIDALEADPYECEHLADIQTSVAGARQALQQPVPPLVYDFKGFLAVIDKLEGLNIATQTPPTSVDGRFLLAMDNAQALIAMGAMFSPELAQLNLQPDGNPVALEMPQVQAMGMSAYAALTENAVAIGVGEDSESDLTGMLDADAADPSPLISFSMDAGRYYAFLGDAIAATEPKEGDKGPSPEMQAAMKDIMNAVAGLYERMTIDIMLTSNGVEMKGIELLNE